MEGDLVRSSSSPPPPEASRPPAVAAPSAESAADDVFDASDDRFKDLLSNALTRCFYNDRSRKTYDCDAVHDGH